MNSGDSSGEKRCRPEADQNASVIVTLPRTIVGTNREKEHKQGQFNARVLENEETLQPADSYDYSFTDNTDVVLYSSIPEYLHNSQLYKTFQEGEHDSDQNFSVPAKFCKIDDSVHSQEDLVHLCHSLRYWGVAELPQTIISAAFGENGVCIDGVMEEFGSELCFLKDLSRIRYLPEADRLLASLSIGSLVLVKYLHEQRGCKFIPNTHSYCSEAAKTGQLHILMFLHENKFHWDVTTTAYAARGGHLNCLQYAHEQGCPWNEATTSCAARCGHLNCLRYAHEQGCPWNKETTRYAASEGHLNCLQYAHEHGCRWDEFSTWSAAREGHLNCLQYAHEHGCPWDKFITWSAARQGHLDCLQYAHRHGCPWDGEAARHASINGHLDCLQYCKDNGCTLQSTYIYHY